MTGDTLSCERCAILRPRDRYETHESIHPTTRKGRPGPYVVTTPDGRRRRLCLSCLAFFRSLFARLARAGGR